MANKRPINKDNPKNIYCDHCEHFVEHCVDRYGIVTMICNNKDSKHYKTHRYYYNRCKGFEWKEKPNDKHRTA